MDTLALPRTHYLNADYGLEVVAADDATTSASRSCTWCSIIAFFLLGGVFAVLIRLELLTPPGDLVSADTYNKLFTMHGIVMIFFFLIPSIPAVLGNFLVPMMIGAKDLAFPRLNLLSWYIFMLGGAVHAVRDRRRRRRHRAGRSTRRSAPRRRTTQRDPGRARRLHHRVLVDPDRAELHRHDPHDAGARA